MPHIVAVKTLKGTDYCDKLPVNRVVCMAEHTHGLSATPICTGLFTPNDVQQMMQEVVKMQDFEHPRVMSLLGVCLDSGVGIVIPFMANGSVLNYIKREKATLLLSEEAEPEEVGCFLFELQ